MESKIDENFQICKSCGVNMLDHLGMTGTCNRLQIAKDALQFIATYGGQDLTKLHIDGESDGLVTSTTGEWCAEQARWALESLK